MKTYSFDIPIFDFKVKLIQIEDIKDLPSLEKHKWLKNMDDEDKEEIFTKIKRENFDGGTTFRSFPTQEFLVIFFKFLSEEAKINTYAHEKRHIEDRLMEYLGINDIETAGYLAGFLAVEFYKFIKKSEKLNN